jgi:hypothetical protein
LAFWNAASVNPAIPFAHSSLANIVNQNRHLKSIDSRKLAALEDLKMSLLRQSFNGEL